MGSKVKQKHLVLLQKKVREKIVSLQEQRDLLISTISDYVAQAESKADRLLATADQHQFMEQYLDVMQELDRCCNTCTLLTAQTDDMIESNGDGEQSSVLQEGNKQDVPLVRTSPEAEGDNDIVPRRSVKKYPAESVCELSDSQSHIAERRLEGMEGDTCLLVAQCNERSTLLDIKGDNLSVRLENEGDNSSCKNEVSGQDLISENAKSENGSKVEVSGSSEQLKDSTNVQVIVDSDKADVELSANTNSVPNSEGNRVPPVPSTPVKENIIHQSASALRTPCKSVAGSSVSEYGSGPAISHCNLTVGPVVPVMVSEIATPWAFYVQPYGLALAKLRTDVNLYQAGLQPGEATIDEPCVGMLCLACFSVDQQYYRAKIITVSEGYSEMSCDVIYVDYGNCESVQASRLLQLPASLAELPSQAIFCSLSGVSPVNRLGLWTEDEINGFRQHVIGQQLYCKATYVSSQHILSFPHLIELYLNIPVQQDSQMGRVLITPVSLAAVLIRLNLARTIGVSEQIAKLQNQYGDVPSTPCSELPSPKKPLNSSKDKVEADVVVEGTEIVYSRTDGCDSNTSDSAATVETCGKPGVQNSERTKEKPVVLSQELTETSQDLNHSAQSRTQLLSEETVQDSLHGSGTVGKLSTLEGSSDSLEGESVCKSQDTSCMEGETTTSGITDMSVNLLSTDYAGSPTEESYNVMIAHIVNPNDFYIHKLTEDVGKTLDRLMIDLNLHFERQSRKRLHKLYHSFTPKLNHLCCAQFSEDNCYYRGYIIGVKEAEEESFKQKEENIGKVHVFFLDFGDEEWLPRSKVYPMPEEFSCFPPLTIWCSLAHVQPVTKHWTQENIQEFDRLAGSEKMLWLCVKEGHLPDSTRCVVQSSPLEVYLVDLVNYDEEICINLELIRTGHASVHIKETDSPRDGSDLDNDPVDLEWNHDTWDPRVEDYISLRNSYNIDVDDPGVATVGYKAQDENRICKYFNTPGRCWRGDYCPYRHVEHAGITRDQAYVFVLEDDQTELLPEEGTMVAVEITSILSPHHFYLNLPFGKTPIDQLPNKKGEEDTEETLEDLIRSMKGTYQNRVFSDRDITLLAPGQAVATKFVTGSEIGWYRAKVTDTSPEEEKVEVFFVDFGHTEWVKEVDIHNLEPEFLHLPQQAIECFLVDVEPTGEDIQWSEESRNKFREMVDGKTLVAQIRTRSWSGCLHLDLYDTSGQTDVNIAEVLVAGGHAQRPQEEPVSRGQRPASPDVILVPG